jgi:hypothetical protein
MISRASLWLAALVTCAAVVPAAADPAGKPQPLRLSAVLTAFLADSSVATRGLAWTTGAALPVKWASARPVAVTEEYLKRGGFTLKREGTLALRVGEATRQAGLHVYGNAAGVQRVSVSCEYQGDLEGHPRELLEASLAADGFHLTPLKCDAKIEGVSYGNLAYVVKAPGRKAAALWESWNCTGTGDCGLSLTLLYRKAELAEVECASP